MWRRWDPHVHMPGTLFNDKFGDTTVKQALDTLATSDPAIEAIGVTDYFTTSSFRRTNDVWKGLADHGIKFLFPNVELRLDIPTARGPGVNLHLLSSPDEVDGLDRFLGALEFSWSERNYRCDLAGLRQLGRDFSQNQQLNDLAALKAGAEQFKVNFEQVRKQFRSDRWASENCLVAVAGGETDGSSGVRTPDDQFLARRESIETFAQIIFSGNPKQSTFWHGRGVDDVEKIRRKYGSLKLCLHGSDAHESAKLGEPDQDRRCWLKGDPCFETLRMACLAPVTRSFIGPRSPMDGFLHGRIARVSIGGTGWRLADKLPINPGLVAVIGARGSGKTALVDLIAAGTGSSQPFGNPASFIRRAGDLLRSCKGSIQWTDGEIFGFGLDSGEPVEVAGRPGVRYLSQQFVEQLCASDGVSGALLTEIERVVFNSWPVAARQGATSFRELLDIRLESARSRQAVEIETIAELGAEIAEQRALRDRLPKLELDLQNLRATSTSHEAQLRALTGPSDTGNALRLVEMSQVLQDRQQQLQQLDRRVTELTALQEEVGQARGSKFPRYTSSLRQQYSLAGLSDSQWEAFGADFVGTVDSILDVAVDEARAALTLIAGLPTGDAPIDRNNLDALSVEQLSALSVAQLTDERARLERLVGLDAQRTKKLAKLNELVANSRSAVTKAEAAIKDASGAESRQADLGASRTLHYGAYFDALLSEEVELNQLYSPLSDLLDRFGASVKRLKFSVKRVVDVETWAARGEDLIDSRMAGAFRGLGELAKAARDELVTAWSNADGAGAAEAIGKFSVRHSAGLRKQSRPANSSAEAYKIWERDVAAWLYSADHVALQYSLVYDGLSIERLSPGTRGIVLLLLYLAVDHEETDPLIIDQPEENLDPESVYSELVALFRSASERRQIIMVTHNANLVVNTDVDQVIVARCLSVEEGRLPTISYTSGGLEVPAIRKAVCEVLEGGAEAFRERARRLGMEFRDDTDYPLA